MYVKKTKQSTGRVNLSIVASHWENGRSKSRTVKNLGFLDVLEQDHDDVDAYAKTICDELNAKAATEAAPVAVSVFPMEKIDKREVGIKNIGCAIPLTYYNKLGIERVLRNHARKKKFEYDTNAILRLLVMERLIKPGSKAAALNNKEHYFFKSDFTDDDIYRSLDFFTDCKESILKAMNKAIMAGWGRDTTRVFYDVTNHYFEINKEDELRRRGVCKEHRPRPIIQMGLLQDSNGIPITYRTYPGNTLDCETMLPVMRDIKQTMDIGRMIMVADKGLNCSDNIAAITLDGNGFVFSQSIRGKKSSVKLREWVISDEGYKRQADEDGGIDFKLKSRQDTKTVHVTGEDNKKHDVDIDIKVVAFWSSKYDARAKYERAKVIEKAKTLIKKPSSYDRAIHYGATKYIDNITVDPKTGEIKEDTENHPSLNLERIAAEERLDGYYCIITSETKLKDTEIIDIYRGLWRIEESFKITKSQLKTRPIFLSTQEHIKAHYLICYIALVLVRLMQFDTNNAYSAAVILDEISQMNGVRLQDNWWRFYHRSDVTDALSSAAGLNLTKKNMQLSSIKKILAEANKS